MRVPSCRSSLCLASISRVCVRPDGLRQGKPGKAGQIVTLGYDLTKVTCAALLDGTMTLIISHPLHVESVCQQPDRHRAI
jgi:hypothetical protein